MSELVDIAIIGAGVAGLTAAERAADLGLSVIVLERADGIGGRVRGIRLADGQTIDASAHWLHQVPINPFVAEAESAGAIQSRPWQPLAGLWINGTWLSDMDIALIWEQIDDIESLAGQLSDADDDVALAALIDPMFTLQTPLRAALAYRYGAAPGDQSAADIARWSRQDGSWPVADGMINLIERRYQSVDVRLNTEVTVLDWGGDVIRLDCGDVLVEARHVIVTASVGELQAGCIHFAPDLPAETIASIQAFTLTQPTRVPVEFSHPIEQFELEAMLLTILDRDPLAIELPAANQLIGAVTSNAPLDPETAVQRIADTLGVDARPLVDGEPHGLAAGATLGPGNAWARVDLGTAIDNRIYFAGEATSLASFGTIHGARAEGMRAVERIAIGLGVLPQISEERNTSSVFRFDL